MKPFLIGLSAAFFAPLAWSSPLSLSSGLPAAVPQAGDLFTGDAKLACEAVLCLSSGKRPSECNESIARYFAIRHKQPHKTLQARRDFLNLCPSSREEMPGLIEALVNGAGRCDAAELNRMGRYTVQKKVCRGYYGNENCTVVNETRIRPTKPSYCQAYHGHDWTDVGGVRYVGEEQSGGRWVDGE